jgi:hypothetical protein
LKRLYIFGAVFRQELPHKIVVVKYFGVFPFSLGDFLSVHFYTVLGATWGLKTSANVY